jgi:hypothetical protein
MNFCGGRNGSLSSHGCTQAHGLARGRSRGGTTIDFNVVVDLGLVILAAAAVGVGVAGLI